MCHKVVDAGEEYCPRHKAMHQARMAEQDEKRRQKELADRLKRQVKTSTTPQTRRGMIEQGYQFIGNDVCVCGHQIEWWRTPNQREAPYEPMKDETSAATTHFKYCKRAFEKKWKRRAA